MSNRSDFRAMTRQAEPADFAVRLADAALIRNGLLLLSAP